MRSLQPPLLAQQLSSCVREIYGFSGDSEAAWSYATRLGSYEALVRAAKLFPDDVDLQCVACDGLTGLGLNIKASHAWPGHSAAGARAGAVRLVAEAVYKHGTRSGPLLFEAACALLGLLGCEGADWEAARSGHAGMALAAGLAVALRNTTATLEATGAEMACVALATIGHDKLCAQEAARGGALLSIAGVLSNRDITLDVALKACLAMQRIATHAPAAVRARAADAGVAALRCVLDSNAGILGHQDLMLLHRRAWYAVQALLDGDEGAQGRAINSGLMNDVVRTLNLSVADAADTGAASAAEAACRLLDFLTRGGRAHNASHETARVAAGAAGAVPAIRAALRVHGCANGSTAAAACGALVGVMYWNLANTREALRARPFADLVLVMRAHSGNNLTTVSATMAIDTLMIHAIMPPDGSGPWREPPALAGQLADAGVLEVAVLAISKRPGDDHMLDHMCFDLLLMTCSGTMPEAESGEVLQPCVAARAKRAGVEAALSAVLARTPPPPKARARAAAEQLLAALAKVPAPRRVCDGCGATDAAKLMRCSRCMAARFCGDACMRASWPTHKTVCTPTASDAQAGAA
jgi:hypothetical protein